MLASLWRVKLTWRFIWIRLCSSGSGKIYTETIACHAPLSRSATALASFCRRKNCTERGASMSSRLRDGMGDALGSVFPRGNKKMAKNWRGGGRLSNQNHSLKISSKKGENERSHHCEYWCFARGTIFTLMVKNTQWSKTGERWKEGRVGPKQGWGWFHCQGTSHSRKNYRHRSKPTIHCHCQKISAPKNQWQNPTPQYNTIHRISKKNAWHHRQSTKTVPQQEAYHNKTVTKKHKKAKKKHHRRKLIYTSWIEVLFRPLSTSATMDFTVSAHCDRAMWSFGGVFGGQACWVRWQFPGAGIEAEPNGKDTLSMGNLRISENRVLRSCNRVDTGGSIFHGNTA